MYDHLCVISIIFTAVCFLIVLVLATAPRDRSRPKRYRYSYQRFPLDDFQEFLIHAENQEEADEKAAEHFAKLFHDKVTIMQTVYKVY